MLLKISFFLRWHYPDQVKGYKSQRLSTPYISTLDYKSEILK